MPDVKTAPPTGYWIWSDEHGMWWRPDSRGYTAVLKEAGIYTHMQAKEILSRANFIQVNEHAIPARAWDGN